MHQGVEEETNEAEGGGVLQPHPGHEENQAMVVSMEEVMRRILPTNELQDCVEELVVFGEVVEIRPESKGAIAVGSLKLTDKPLQTLKLNCTFVDSYTTSHHHRQRDQSEEEVVVRNEELEIFPDREFRGLGTSNGSMDQAEGEVGAPHRDRDPHLAQSCAFPSELTDVHHVTQPSIPRSGLEGRRRDVLICNGE